MATSPAAAGVGSAISRVKRSDRTFGHARGAADSRGLINTDSKMEMANTPPITPSETVVEIFTQ